MIMRSFFRVFFVPFPLSLCMDYRVRRTFFPSGWCFFYLVTTGWIFDISLCENLSMNGERLIRGYTKFDFTVNEVKGRLDPSRDEN